MTSVGATEIYLFLAIFTLSCGWIAHRRGRFVVGWAVTGLIFGPLALVVLLLLPRTKNRQQKVNSPQADEQQGAASDHSST